MHQSLTLNSLALDCFIKNIPQPAYLNLIHDDTAINANELGRKFLASKTTKSLNILNRRVALTGKTVTKKNCCLLDDTGFINFYTVVKIPVHNDKGQIAAVLTINFKPNQVINPIDLFSHYKSLGIKRQTAINRILKQLKLDNYFSEILTEKELLCLLHMRVETSRKVLAEKLFVSTKTVETHVSKLLKKSKQHCLEPILTQLRNGY